MLRMVFAIAFILYGARQSFKGPFHALLFYLALAYFRPETWVWGDALQSLNLSFIVGVCVVLFTLCSSRERLNWSVPVIMVVALCLHGLCSTLMSPHFDWSFFWWKGFAKVTMITVLIVSLVNTPERFRLTLVVIALALGFEGVKQGWAFLVSQSAEPNTNSMDILGDNNGVAVGMLMLTSVLMALYQTSKGAFRKGTFAFMGVGTTIRALSTFSRGGLISLGAMGAVYWLRSKHRVRIGLAIAIVGVGLLSMMPKSFWTRMNTITTDEEQMDSSSAGRLHFWRTAVNMANDHPIFGVGHTGFQVTYDAYDDSDGRYGHDRAVHSTWFGILAEQGYVGLVLFIAILAAALRACGHARRLTRKAVGREDLFTYASALQTALITVAVGGTFLSYHYVEILWHFIGLAFASYRIALSSAVAQPVSAPLTTHARSPLAAAAMGAAAR